MTTPPWIDRITCLLTEGPRSPRGSRRLRAPGSPRRGRRSRGVGAPRRSFAPATGLAALLIGALLLSAGAGCTSVRPSYSAHTRRPHKDVVVLIVVLDQRLDVDGYLDIVETEVDELDLTSRDPHVPVWEARFEFLLSPRSTHGTSERLASVSLFAAEDAAGEAPRAPREWRRRITIY